MGRVDNLEVWRSFASVVRGCCANVANAFSSVMHKSLGFFGGVRDVVVARFPTRVPARLRGEGLLLWRLGFFKQRFILQRMRSRRPLRPVPSVSRFAFIVLSNMGQRDFHIFHIGTTGLLRSVYLEYIMNIVIPKDNELLLPRLFVVSWQRCHRHLGWGAAGSSSTASACCRSNSSFAVASCSPIDSARELCCCEFPDTLGGWSGPSGDDKAPDILVRPCQRSQAN
jgi:hypothetical protein